MQGGFFLRKKPLSILLSVYTNPENALAPAKTLFAANKQRQGLKPSLVFAFNRHD
jgi:hypothetical protein